MENHHLQKGVGSWEKLAHNDLKKLLALEILLGGGELDLQLLEQGWDFILLEVHDGIEDAEDGVQDELVEGTLKGLTLVRTDLGPLLGLGVEVAVALEAVSICTLS